MIAKKGIDTGDDLDQIPDSMRQLLAMQAMQEGKPFPAHLMGRPGAPINAYGSGGMLMAGDMNNSGKVGKCSFDRSQDSALMTPSDTPLQLPISEHWQLAPCWPECYGSCRLLFA